MRTYILGAGASAHCVPTLNGFASGLENIKRQLAVYLGNNYGDNSSKTWDLLNDLKSKLSELSGQIVGEITERNYMTIDAFLKKLYLTGKEDYQSYKLVLEAALFYWESLNKFDNRYTQFISDFFYKNHRGIVSMVEPVMVLSWNYDYQLELAVADFFNCPLSMVNKFINYNIYQFDANRINLFKLNGSYSFESTKYSLNANQGEKVAIAKLVDKWIADNGDEKNSIMSFSWEKGIRDTKKSIDSLMLERTRNAVIIGYSFHNFNSEVDSYIMQKLIGANVFLQLGPKDNSNSEPFLQLQRYRPLLSSRTGAHTLTEFITNVNSFHVPRTV